MLTLCAIAWALIALGQPAPVDEVSSTSEFVCLDQACYSISWEKKRFSKAKTVCEARKGQLLNVRNSVQADVISLFLARVEEDVRLWIGLEQPFRNRCTVGSQRLRGFTWVSGDNQTDYDNWRNPGVRKCGAQCVIVHKDLTWEETDCEFKADGYLCELNNQNSCNPLNLPKELNITYSHMSLGRSVGALLPPGTSAHISTLQDPLLCASEGEGQAQWRRLIEGPWDCHIENGGCENDCLVEDGSPKCTCPPESKLKEDNRTCTKPCDPNPCGQLCNVIEYPPGFTCVCEEGYYLADDSKTCIDIDDCLVPNICEEHCTNTIGSFVCGCKPGSEMVPDPDCDNGDECSLVCADINECDSPLTNCEQECENLQGSYRCFCLPGFVVDEKNPNKCKIFCNTSFCEADCDINSQDKCKCPDGYIVDQDDEGMVICTDVDECETNPCDGTCTNTFGSYTCTCPEGFTVYGPECRSIDEGSGIPETTTTTTTKRPYEPPPTRPSPPDIHSLQPAMLLGICIGVISMLTVLVAILCHMLRKHYMEQHALDYKTKSTEMDVRLQQVKTDPQRRL